MTQRKADLTGSVAVISSDVIEKNSYSNVMQGLQGRVPGMHITTDGSPVGNVNVQIRGLTSMRSAPPLVVIDGLPTNINLRDINPNDIASMQVLKDAASASIYGSRAASGVILIETKSGKAGETRVTYDGSTGVSSFMNRIKMMNTAQYGQALWQAAINDGRDPNKVTQIYNYDWHRDEHGIAVLDKVTPLEWLNADKTMPSADTDWFKEGSQLGLQNNHQLTLLNGTEKAQTMLSLNFFENRGTQIHTGFRRYSVRLNSEYNLIGDRLKIGENLAVSNSKINDQNHSHSFLTMPPIIPVYTTDGGWGGTAYNLGMDDYNNPVRMLTMEKDNDRKESKILGSIYANLKLLKNLNFKTLYGVDYSTGYFRHIDFTWEEGGGKRDINNGVRNNQFHALTTTWTNTLNYNLNIGNHELNSVAGIEAVRYVFEEMGGFRRDIEFEDYDYAYLNSATGNQEAYGRGDEWALLSYFSKFNW
jgi:TonB-dependent SusC/RagA subfamily outer membrane receptor